MSISYIYDRARGILDTTAVGDVNFDEVSNFFDRVRDEPWFPPPSLIDVRQASVDVTGAQIRMIAERFRSFGSVMCRVPVAVLVDSAVSFGLVRMLGLLLDDIAMIRPFRCQEAALAWIREHCHPD